MNATHKLDDYPLRLDEDEQPWLDAVAAWADKTGINAGAIPITPNHPFLYDADTGEAEYSLLARPELGFYDPDQKVERVSTTLSEAPPLAWFTIIRFPTVVD